MADSSFWRELADQFRALPLECKLVRADRYPLDDGTNTLDRWELSGTATAKALLDSLARRAGSEVTDPLSSNLLAAWLEALLERGGVRFKSQIVSTGNNSDGSPRPQHTVGSLYELPEHSANYCKILESEALEAEAEQRRRNDPKNWTPFRREFEVFKNIRDLRSGSHEQVPEAFVRDSLARQLGIKPEEVTWKQIQHAVSGLLPHYPAITLIPTVPVPVANTSASIPSESQGQTIGHFSDVLKLPNKESLFTDLADQFQGKRLFSILFIDLDNFKAVNDSLGHPEGDACLTKVASQFSGTLSGKGRLYKVGGDEFCILLPNFSSREAAATAERIREGVDSLKPIGGKVKVTTSIGVASSELPTARDAESLYALADKALYVSKGAGKNQVTIAPSGSEGERPPATSLRETQHERKHRMRNQVAEFLTQGQKILDGIEYSNLTSVQEKQEWKFRVQRYLAENLDDSYGVRFASPKYRVSEFPTTMVQAMRPHWAEVRSRMDMLHDFIAELRD